MPKKKKISKSQVQLILFGVLILVIIGVLIYFVSAGPSLTKNIYEPKNIDIDLSGEVFEHSEYKKLRSPVVLPITPGPTGRDNPFNPY